MAKLFFYLPPFASDYSGVCSALYSLNCLTVIHDASCCTEHFVYYDEPRWERLKRPVLSTQLRNTDAVLGNDAGIIRRIERAIQDIGCDIIALAGTPVPAIIGTDMKGMAAEVEAKTGKPSFGFNTSGFRYYDAGIFLAGKALAERFATHREDTKRDSRTVNIIGMTPLDYGDQGTEAALVSLLEELGFQAGCCLFADNNLSSIERLPLASVNLAVSAAGLKLSKHFNKMFGTPCLAHMPLGNVDRAALKSLLDTAVSQGGGPDGGESPLTEKEQPLIQNERDREPDTRTGRMLIVGDQVCAASVRRALEERGLTAPVDVASFFGWSRSLALPGDTFLQDEKALISLIRSGRYDTIVGDPLLAQIPDVQSLRHIKLAHPAVSGKLHWGNVPLFIGEQFEEILLDIARS